MRATLRLLILSLILPLSFARGAAPPPGGLERVSVTVDGVARTALVHAPPNARSASAPVVFVFHGHGGTAEHAARGFAMHRNWPEAISVYMQGLNTPGILSDPEGKRSGWQAGVGHQGDRDLKFFDAMLARLKRDYKVDDKRIYSTGHSNGGGFTYLLWHARGKVLAAVAPSGSTSKYASQLAPKPALIIGGENDPMVKFEWQKRTMDIVRKINGCAPAGESWDKQNKQCTLYPSKAGAPLVTFIYPGGHALNPVAPALIMKFFKQHPGDTGKPGEPADKSRPAETNADPKTQMDAKKTDTK